MAVPVHLEVLHAAQRLCRERGRWTFVAEDIVRALPHLNEHSVRTHVSSRCCVNAPAHHGHRWPYFKRLARGMYEVARAYRIVPSPEPADHVAERAPRFGRASLRPPRDTIHAVIHRDGKYFV